MTNPWEREYHPSDFDQSASNFKYLTSAVPHSFVLLFAGKQSVTHCAAQGQLVHAGCSTLDAITFFGFMTSSLQFN